MILKHLNDPEDQLFAQQVNELRSLSEANEAYFVDLKKIWDLSVQTAPLYEVDEETSVSKFKSGLRLRDGIKPFRLYRWLSAAAAVFFVAVLGVWFYFQQTAVTYLIAASKGNQIDSVMLADGSHVFLAGNSAIRYPSAFKGGERQISLLKGQAFFKIARDPKHPFEVAVNHSVVRVLGTSFNINYSGNTISLSVKTGRVMFTPNSKSDPAILTAGDALSYNFEKNQLTKENGLNSNGWLTKQLRFVDMPLEEVCRQLSMYYNVKVVLLAHTKTAKKLNANFSNTDIDEVLKVLKETYPIRVQQKDSIIYIKNL
jgi:transmembrane sensor